MVKGLDGLLKTLAIIFHDDKYSKGKLSAVVVRGINKNLKHWVTTENPKPQVIPEKLIFPAPIIYLPQKIVIVPTNYLQLQKLGVKLIFPKVLHFGNYCVYHALALAWSDYKAWSYLEPVSFKLLSW